MRRDDDVRGRDPRAGRLDDELLVAVDLDGARVLVDRPARRDEALGERDQAAARVELGLVGEAHGAGDRVRERRIREERRR